MVPPVPIPNTVVKHVKAESTWLETAREDRKLPVKMSDTPFGVSLILLQGAYCPTGGPGMAREQDTISFGETSPERTKSEPQNLSMLKRSVNQA